MFTSLDQEEFSQLLPARFVYQDGAAAPSKGEEDVEDEESKKELLEKNKKKTPEQMKKDFESALRDHQLAEERTQKETEEALKSGDKSKKDLMDTTKALILGKAAEKLPKSGEAFKDWVKESGSDRLKQLEKIASGSGVDLLKWAGLDWKKAQELSKDFNKLGEAWSKLSSLGEGKSGEEFAKWAQKNPAMAIASILGGAYGLYKVVGKILEKEWLQDTLIVAGGTVFAGHLLGLEKVQKFFKDTLGVDIDESKLAKTLIKLGDLDLKDALKEIKKMFGDLKLPGALGDAKDKAKEMLKGKGKDSKPEKTLEKGKENWIPLSEAMKNYGTELKGLVRPITTYVEAHPIASATLAAYLGGAEMISAVTGTLKLSKEGFLGMARILKHSAAHPVRGVLVISAFLMAGKEGKDMKVPPNSKEMMEYLKTRKDDIAEYVEENGLGDSLNDEQLDIVVQLMYGDLGFDDLNINYETLKTQAIDGLQNLLERTPDEQMKDRNLRGFKLFRNHLKMEFGEKPKEQKELLDQVSLLIDRVRTRGSITAEELHSLQLLAKKHGIKISTRKGYIVWGMANKQGNFIDPKDIYYLGINPEASEELQREAVHFYVTNPNQVSSVVPEIGRVLTERAGKELADITERMQNGSEDYFFLNKGKAYVYDALKSKYYEVPLELLEGLKGNFSAQEFLITWADGVVPAMIIASPIALAKIAAHRSLYEGGKVIFKSTIYPISLGTDLLSVGFNKVLRPFYRGVRAGGDYGSLMNGINEVLTFNKQTIQEFLGRMSTKAKYQLYRRFWKVQLDELRKLSNMKDGLRRLREAEGSLTLGGSDDALKELRTFFGDNQLRHLNDVISEDDIAGSIKKIRAMIEAEEASLKNIQNGSNALEQMGGDSLRALLNDPEAGKAAWLKEIPDEYKSFMSEAADAGKKLGFMGEGSEGVGKLSQGLREAEKAEDASKSLLAGSRKWLESKEWYKGYKEWKGLKFRTNHILKLSRMKDEAEIAKFLKARGVEQAKIAELSSTLKNVENPEDVIQAIRTAVGPEKVKFSPKMARALRSMRWAGMGLATFASVAGFAYSTYEVGKWGYRTGSGMKRAYNDGDWDRLGISGASTGMWGLNMAADGAGTYALYLTITGAEVGVSGTLGAVALPLIPVTAVGANVFDSMYERTETITEWYEKGNFEDLIHEWICSTTDNAGDRFRDVVQDNKTLAKEKDATSRKIVIAIINQQEGKAADAEPNPHRVLFLEHIGLSTAPRTFAAAVRYLNASQQYADMMNMRTLLLKMKEKDPSYTFVLNGVDILDKKFEKPNFDDLVIFMQAFVSAELEMIAPKLEQHFKQFTDAYLIDLWAQTETAGQNGAEGLTAQHKLFAFNLSSYLIHVRDINLNIELLKWRMRTFGNKQPSQKEMNELSQNAVAAVDQFQKNPSKSLQEDLKHDSLDRSVNAVYELAKFFGYMGYPNRKALQAFFTEAKAKRQGIYFESGKGWYMNDNNGGDDFMGEKIDSDCVKNMIHEFQNDWSDIFESRQDSLYDVTMFGDYQRKLFETQSKALARRLGNGRVSAVRAPLMMGAAQAEITPKKKK